MHWFSIKYKQVTKSILAAKLYRIAHSFDIRVIIKAILEKVFQVKIHWFFI